MAEKGPGELWCCAACEQIGSLEQAQGHEAKTGHSVRRLNSAEERGVRELWQEEGRSQIDGSQAGGLAGALASYGRLFRGGGGGGLDGPDF